MAVLDVRKRKPRGSRDYVLVNENVCVLQIKNTGRRKSPEHSKYIRSFNNGFVGDRNWTQISNISHQLKSENCPTQHFVNNLRSKHLESSEVPQSNTWLYMTVWIVSVLSYINGLTGDFVHDDLSAITSNPDVIGRNPLYHVLFNDYWGKPLSHPLSHKSYRPLTILTFRATHCVVGLSPCWYHLGNVALHSAVCLLFARVLTRLLRSSAALTPALIFATHPIHVEAVTGVVGRADLLAAMCLLLALLAYHNGVSQANRCTDEGIVWKGVRWAGTWALLGTLCKEHAITALLVCCVWDCVLHRRLILGYLANSGQDSICYCVSQNSGLASPHMCSTQQHCCNDACNMERTPASADSSSDSEWTGCCSSGPQSSLLQETPNTHSCPVAMQFLIRRIIWVIIMGAFILMLRLWMLRGSSPAFSDQDNPASFSPQQLTRLLTFLYLPALNCWLLLCPWSLSHDWQMGSVSLVSSLSDARNALSLLFYTSLALLLYRAVTAKGSENRSLQMGLALLLLPFLPATNVFFRVGFVLAERILYIPSMGYCLLVSIGLQRLKRLKVPLLLLLLLLFSARTIRRNYDWQSRTALFTAGLRTMPGNAKMHYNYGNLQRDLDNTALAQLHYREAIRLWPDHASAHNNLGTLLNDSREAEEHFRAALRAHPQHAHASYNLAKLRLKQGAKKEAVSLLEASLRWDALYRDAVCALAELYVTDNKSAEADTLHRDLLMATPEDAVAHNNYAAFLQRAGRKEAALHHYETALSLDPDHTVALVNTARLLRALNHDDHAEVLYRRALNVAWEAGIEESLGKLYLNTDRLDKAQAAFTAVLAKKPDRLSARVYLARVQLQQHKYDETEATLNFVLEEDPSYPEALLQLSLLYAHTNRTLQALALATSAAEMCSAPPSVCAHLLAHRADLLHAQRNTDAAMKSYEAALELDSTLSHAHVNLGAIFHSKGDHAQAWHHYLTAQTHDPTNSLLLENMDKLRKSHHPIPPLTPLNCLTIS